MDSFYLAVSVVFPLLVYMAVGGIVRKLNMFSYENFKSLNGLIFNLFIPLSLFLDVYKADIRQAFQPGIFLFVFVCILIAWGTCWFIYTKTVDGLSDQATMIQGSFRSNYVLFGTTIGLVLCSEEGVALMAALMSITVPMFNILSVVTFELKRGGKVKAVQLIRSIFRNPLVDATLIALAFHVLHIPIPQLMLTPLTKLAAASNPVALVALGGMLSFGSIIQHRKLLAAAVSARIVIIPCIVLAAALMFGMRGDELVAILAIFASPTAVASGPMAQAMGGNVALAGEIVALTSTLCIVTLFLMVFGLSSAGML